jgi:hypothetical protein
MLISLLRGLAGDQQRLICGERGGSCALRERARASGSQGQRELVRETADQRMQRRGGGSVRSSLSFPCFARLSVFATWLFGQSNNRRGTGPWVRGRLGGTRLGAASSSCSSEGEIFYWSSDLFLTNVRCNSHYSIFTSSMPVVSTLMYERRLHGGSLGIQHVMRPCVTRSLGQFAATAVVTSLACTLHTLV